VYESEEQQVEALKKWWRENGRFVIAGLVVGAVAVFGWRGWVSHQQERAAAAAAQQTELYAALQAGDTEKVQSLSAALLAQYADTPSAVHAALALAKVAVDKQDYAAAQEHLQWVLDNAADEPLQLIARLRLARVLLAQDDAAAALQKLGLAEPGEFAGLYAEARGDAYVALGDAAMARAAYEEALAALEPGVGDRSLLEMKLNELHVAPADQATDTAIAE